MIDRDLQAILRGKSNYHSWKSILVILVLITQVLTTITAKRWHFETNCIKLLFLTANKIVLEAKSLIQNISAKYAGPFSFFLDSALVKSSSRCFEFPLSTERTTIRMRVDNEFKRFVKLSLYVRHQTEGFETFRKYISEFCLPKVYILVGETKFYMENFRVK